MFSDVCVHRVLHAAICINGVCLPHSTFIFQLWLSHTGVAVFFFCNVLIGQIWDRYPPTARLTDRSAQRLRKGSPLPPHKCWPCRGIMGGVISMLKIWSDVPDLLTERITHTAGAWTCGSLGSNYILFCSGLSIEQLCSQTKHCYCITVCRLLSSEMTQQLTVN